MKNRNHKYKAAVITLKSKCGPPTFDSRDLNERIELALAEEYVAGVVAGMRRVAMMVVGPARHQIRIQAARIEKEGL